MMISAIYLYVSSREKPHPGLTFFIFIGYVLIIGGIIKLVNNGFFAKKPSDQWDHKVLRSNRPLFYYVYWLAAMVVIALIGVYYVITYKPVYLDGGKIDDDFKYIWFYISFILLLAGLLNSHLVKSDTSFTDYPYLRYIMKVWMTNILATPVLITIISALKEPALSSSAGEVPNYLILVVTSNGFGLLGFAAFAFNVHYLSQHNWPERHKKLRIFASTQLLTLVTVAVFSLKSNIGLSWFALWLPYALVIGFSVFYYKLEKPIPVEDAIVLED